MLNKQVSRAGLISVALAAVAVAKPVPLHSALSPVTARLVIGRGSPPPIPMPGTVDVIEGAKLLPGFSEGIMFSKDEPCSSGTVNCIDGEWSQSCLALGWGLALQANQLRFCDVGISEGGLVLGAEKSKPLDDPERQDPETPASQPGTPASEPETSGPLPEKPAPVPELPDLELPSTDLLPGHGPDAPELKPEEPKPEEPKPEEPKPEEPKPEEPKPEEPKPEEPKPEEPKPEEPKPEEPKPEEPKPEEPKPETPAPESPKGNPATDNSVGHATVVYVAAEVPLMEGKTDGIKFDDASACAFEQWLNCMDGRSYQRCEGGIWHTIPVEDGLFCTVGQSFELVTVPM
jgi:hypothetical protein